MALNETLPYTNTTIIQVLVSIIVLFFGFIAVKIIVRIFKKGLEKTELPEIVIGFLLRFLSALLYVVVVLLVASTLGFSIGPVFIGLSAALGLILGFGMQDSLNNLAAGVWLAALRPFGKGDVVTVSGETGKVSAVGIMATELLTPDNKFIAIPNKLVWGSTITNFSKMPTRRVDVGIGISYESDLNKAISLAMTLMKDNDLVLDNPEPGVGISELADSSINLTMRAWTKTDDYWTVMGYLKKGILESYNANGINIPYPHRVIINKD